MKKLISFLVITSIIFLSVMGLSACGEVITSTPPPAEEVSPAPETPTSTPPETPAPTEPEAPAPATPSVEGQVVLAELFTGDW